MFDTKIVEKAKTHILCSIIPFENGDDYGENSVQPDRPATEDNKTGHIRIACWIIYGYKNTLRI